MFVVDSFGYLVIEDDKYYVDFWGIYYKLLGVMSI